MYQKVLCLTPECSKLWALRPGLGFLYDSIIIDQRDYESILIERDTSTYNFLMARNVERFRLEGLLQIKDYSTILQSEERKFIHSSACDYIEKLDENKQVELLIHAHKDYYDYLKAQLLFCQTDEPKFKQLGHRLTKISERLKDIKANSEVNIELSDSLIRVAAKSLAGACIVNHFEGAHLFDTSEYRPFITGMSMENIVYHDEAETKAVDVLAAIILNKALPDITVYDDYTMTQFLSTRDEFTLLHSMLSEIVKQYGEVLKSDPQIAKEHLHNQFNAAIRKLEHFLLPIKKRSNLLWKVTEVLGTLKVPIISSLLEPLKKKNIEEYKQKQLDKLKADNELMANMIFVFDEVKYGNKPLEIEIKRTWKKPEERKTIWGQEGEILPWYEKD